MIVSAHTYLWFITLMTGLVALYWIIIDSVRLTRAPLRWAPRAAPGA